MGVGVDKNHITLSFFKIPMNLLSLWFHQEHESVVESFEYIINIYVLLEADGKHFLLNHQT